MHRVTHWGSVKLMFLFLMTLSHLLKFFLILSSKALQVYMHSLNVELRIFVKCCQYEVKMESALIV